MAFQTKRKVLELLLGELVVDLTQIIRDPVLESVIRDLYMLLIVPGDQNRMMSFKLLQAMFNDEGLACPLVSRQQDTRMFLSRI